jgi:glucose/arabinose dehydrogenase
MMRHRAVCAVAVSLWVLSVAPAGRAAPGGDPLESITLPPGFVIRVYADDVKQARSLALGTNGTVFVGSLSRGTVTALLDRDRDGRADEAVIVAEDLNTPNGVAFRDGALYVAEINRILRFDGIEDRLTNPPQPVVVNDSFPSDRAHGWKFIAFGPDGKLYVPVGAPCNVCEKEDARYSTIMRMDPDGANLEIFAHGVRNTVGFSWHPDTGELWFTDNGRDWLGDDLPPDELNRAPGAGLHFGFPYVHGGDLLDPEFGKGKRVEDFTPPVQKLGPHVASLGMRFYTGNRFPAEYRKSVFIAEHGSWNRSKPIGYRITRVKLDGNRAISYEPFAFGWLRGGDVSGRPVDVLVMPDGALLVSDDHAGKVYRITYEQ